MQTRSLGATGIPVTPIGLGLAALGRPGYINLGHAEDLSSGREVEAMRAHCHRMLDLAWALGIRYVDAARSYGRAEEFLGGWLRQSGVLPSVGSKWGYTYTAGWRVQAQAHEVKDHSLPVLEHQWAETAPTWVSPCASTRSTPPPWRAGCWSVPRSLGGLPPSKGRASRWGSP
jgi:aryl-alcohol dehydrogenase-like predicted oxidoreductase